MTYLSRQQVEEMFDERFDVTAVFGKNSEAGKDLKSFIHSIREKDIEERNKWLHFFVDDIRNCFIPKCTSCNRRATEQTQRGKDAQVSLARPVNWEYYCKSCADKGRAMENEAMYG